MVEKLELENEVKCSADKLYNMWKNDVHEIPKHIPHIFKSVEILEGEHGTDLVPIKIWHYEIDGRNLNVTERTTMDDEKRSITHTILGGELYELYKNFVSKITITPQEVDGHVDGSLVKWELTYEKMNENIPPPTNYLILAEKITKDLATAIHV